MSLFTEYRFTLSALVSYPGEAISIIFRAVTRERHNFKKRLRVGIYGAFVVVIV